MELDRQAENDEGREKEGQEPLAGASEGGELGGRYWDRTSDLLGVNEWQEGQQRSSAQAGGSILGDRGRLEATWLPPYSVVLVYFRAGQMVEHGAEELRHS